MIQIDEHIFWDGLGWNHQLDDFGKERFWSSNEWQKFTTNDFEASRWVGSNHQLPLDPNNPWKNAGFTPPIYGSYNH